jgi:NADH:ubiquinone oxidoreductase subunit E/NAD-dependent dihydropyrimidine dehydrogenase PreA subunit
MKKDNKVGAVLVVGAGIGGIQASLDLADSGYKVYLMDKRAAIGGTMAQLDKTFPTNDCSMCILAPKLVDAGRHENIEVVTLSDVEGIDGEPGNFKVRIKKRPRYVDESKCTGCGTCWSNCPVTSKPQIPEEKPRVRLDEDVLQKVNDIVNKYKHEKSVLISVLLDVNKEYKYFPKEILVYVSEELDIPLSQIYNVASFYSAFSLEPRGEHIVSVCMGTACHVRGAPRVLDELERKLGIKAGETTEDMKYTLETVNCLGACALGPLVTIDGKYYGKMSAAKVEKILQEKR